MKNLILLLIFFHVHSASAANSPRLEKISGPNVVTGKIVETKTQKGLVVVFLSAYCPCSNSHLTELAALSNEHPGYEFIGVHSNSNEKPEEAKKYFKNAGLPFSVIQDKGGKIADDLKAYKTPHAYIFNQAGEVVYQGGVSNSRDFDRSDRKYLREALDDLKKGQAVRTPEGRTLGCVISRGDKNVW